MKNKQMDTVINIDEHFTPKDRVLSMMEMMHQCFKYRGVLSSLAIAFHYIICRFFKDFVKSNTYSFLGFKIVFANIKQVSFSLFEVFGLNVYFFKSTVKDPVIVDIGANFGDSVLYFKWLYPDSKIYAFEPLPNAFKLLQENVLINKFNNVHLFNVGLGSKDASIKIYSDDYGTSGSSTLNETTSTSRFKDNAKVQNAKIVKASKQKVLNSLQRIDLLKIDIEGAEGPLLEELKGVLPKTRRIILEYHVIPDVTKNSFDEIVTLLRGYDFRLSFTGFYRNIKNVSDPFAFLIIADKKIA